MSKKSKEDSLFKQVKEKYLYLLEYVIRSTIFDTTEIKDGYSVLYRNMEQKILFNKLTASERVQFLNFILDNHLYNYCHVSDMYINDVFILYQNKDIFIKVKEHLLDITNIDYDVIKKEIPLLGTKVYMDVLHLLQDSHKSVKYQDGSYSDDFIFRFFTPIDIENDSPYEIFMRGYDSILLIGYNKEKHCYYSVRCLLSDDYVELDTKVVAIGVLSKHSRDFFKTNVLGTFEKYYKNTYNNNTIVEPSKQSVVEEEVYVQG